MAKTKLPAFQFYPGDWMKDPSLRSCSIAARGLWIDTICLMFESPRRGYLEHANGQPVTPVQLSRMVGATLKEAQTAIDELEAADVFSRADSGAIYSRRMVRDEGLRQVRAQGGLLGAEHGSKGAEHGSKGGRPEGGFKGGSLDSGKPPLQAPSDPPLKPPPSSSSSSSSSEEDKNPLTPFPENLDTERFRETWYTWAQHRTEIKKPLKPSQTKTQLARLSKEGEAAAIERIEQSIANGWQGLWFAGQATGKASSSRPDFLAQGQAAFEAAQERQE